MTFFSWDDTFSTSIKDFDDHHKQLIQLFNDVYEKVFNCEDIGEERILTQQTLHDLAQYINYHFAAEEELMIRFAYPQYQEHKQQHDYYTAEVRKLEAEHEKGGVALSFTAFMLLKDWITNHIVTADKKYGEFFHKHGVK